MEQRYSLLAEALDKLERVAISQQLLTLRSMDKNYGSAGMMALHMVKTNPMMRHTA